MYWRELSDFRKASVAVAALLVAVFLAVTVQDVSWDQDPLLDPGETVSFTAEASGPMGQFSWYYNRSSKGGRIVEHMVMDNRTYRQVRDGGEYRTQRVFQNGSTRLYRGDIKLRDFNSYVTRPYLLRGRSFDYSSIDTYRGREVFNTSYRQIEGFSYTGDIEVVRDVVYVDRETGLVLYSLWVRETPDGPVREELTVREFSNP
jgi:hypothetical protein